MEQLNHLIKDASNQFECHNFQTSLSLYVRCIQQCEEQGLPTYILHNLKSSEAALRAILGDQEAALKILNEVLAADKQHWLSLMRRSQIYKKQNKLKKALKDLEILSMYAPDNMQVAAFKLQLKTLMSKSSDDSFEQSSESQCIDEEKVLQFSNLRKIDRCSISILVPKGRQSRVTISGDKSFCYQSDRSERAPKQSFSLAPHLIRQKFIEIEGELEETGDSDQNQSPVVVVKSKPSRTKSILRNRDSALYISDKKEKSLLSTPQGKKLIEKLQDIEGHIIGSENGSAKNCSEREVQFKKSSFEEDPEIVDYKITIKKPVARKSCLKRSSFSFNEQLTQKSQGGRRSSKFDNLSRNSIDGKFLRSDKKRHQIMKEASKQNIKLSNDEDSENQSEVGSHYNIFGSKKLVLNKQLRQNLGFGSDEIMELETPEEKEEKKPKCRTQSILKKTSILVKENKKKTSVFFQESNANELKPEKKSKKSVMFRSC